MSPRCSRLLTQYVHLFDLDAFEVFYKRCKAVKDHLATLGNGEEVYHFCTTNWHFLRLFEGHLFHLVKAGEITDKFDSLTKSTASKIEKFIKEQVANYVALTDVDTRLKGAIKEYESLYKLQSKDFREKRNKLKQDFDNLLSCDFLE